MFLTLEAFIAICMLLIAVIGLVVEICSNNKKR